jgi:hypothetical protein
MCGFGAELRYGTRFVLGHVLGHQGIGPAAVGPFVDEDLGAGIPEGAAEGTLFRALRFIQSKEQYSRISYQCVSSLGTSRNSAMRRISRGMSRFRLAKCTNRTFGRWRNSHQVRTFSQNGQKGWPSRSIQARKY